MGHYGRTKVNVATELLPIGCDVQGRINSFGSLAVVTCKHVGIDRKCHARLGVSQPFRNRHDIHTAGNELACVCIPEPMELDVWRRRARPIHPSRTTRRSGAAVGPPSWRRASRVGSACRSPTSTVSQVDFAGALRSASLTMLGMVMSRRPALVFAPLNRMP